MAVLSKVFRGTRRQAADIAPGTIAHGTIRRGEQVLDEVIVARLDGTASPAGEPWFEVNCHGGAAAVGAVLRCLEEAGAQLTEWRELMPRPPEALALCSRRIAALAHAALPDASTRLAALMLLYQAAGATAQCLMGIAAALRECKRAEALERLDFLIGTWRLGSALLLPPRVALLGPPNVGKSTLLNALLHQERAIVHHQPGTTRDVVAETVAIGGVPFEIADAAGLRESEDHLERRAVERARQLASTCDVALLLFDASQSPAPLGEVHGLLKPGAAALLVGNKIDLLPSPRGRPELPEPLASLPLLWISAKQGTGIGQLQEALLAPYEPYIRHCRAGGAVVFDRSVLEALTSLREVVASGTLDQAREALENLAPEAGAWECGLRGPFPATPGSEERPWQTPTQP